MTSSRSRTSTSKLFALVVVLLGWLVVLAPAAAVAGRKRVVVLELDGPKAEKFQSELIKLIKRTHTVIPVKKWNSTAEDLDASSVNAKNIKKVAKKLKIDAVITGKVTKRRDEYIVQLKLYEGKSGKAVGKGIDIKAESVGFRGSAKGDVEDELIPVISEVSSNRSGFGGRRDADEEDEEDEAPRKKVTKVAKKSRADEKDEEEEEEDDEDPLPRSRKASKSRASDDDDDDRRSKKKRSASRDEDEDEDDDEEGISEEADVDGLEGAAALTPGERAIDFVAGLSFNARRMGFKYSADLGSKPPPYKGVPVAGVLIDATVFPLAMGHTRRGILKDIGLTVMYDKVIKINSQAGMTTLPTTQARYAFGAAFRKSLGSLTVGASLRYGRQNFTLAAPPAGVVVDIQNVNYTIIDPALSLKYQVGAKIVLGVNAGFMLVTGTGAIQKPENYGAATVTGFEGELGGDYLFTKNLFARAAFRFQTIGFTFKGTGMLTTMRDSDLDQDVFGARDNYLGGALTLGYLY